MPVLHGRNYSRNELLDYVGNIAQLAGAACSQTTGIEAGADVIQMWNSSGLHVNLAPGRCLDITQATFNGINLGFRTSTPVLGPAFYEADGKRWLHGFNGGLLATCGLRSLGEPQHDPDAEAEYTGLHGRIAYQPAENVHIERKWEGEDYWVHVQGEIRETSALLHNLLLTRRLSMKLGEKTLYLHDRVENQHRTQSSPFMLVYHINPAFPLLDPAAELHLRSRRAVEFKSGVKAGPDEYLTIKGPEANVIDVFIHDCIPDQKGWVNVGLINPNLGDGGMGLLIRYPLAELPILNQWRNYETGNYVMGIEPGNCTVQGRVVNREAGVLQELKPGEVREFHVEFHILSGSSEIENFRDRQNY